MPGASKRLKGNTSSHKKTKMDNLLTCPSPKGHLKLALAHVKRSWVSLSYMARPCPKKQQTKKGKVMRSLIGMLRLTEWLYNLCVVVGMTTASIASYYECLTHIPPPQCGCGGSEAPVRPSISPSAWMQLLAPALALPGHSVMTVDQPSKTVSKPTITFLLLLELPWSWCLFIMTSD